MSSTSSTSSLTMIQALQSIGSVAGDFDESKCMPKVHFDAGELVRTVGILWNNMKEQRSFLELVEKEMASRKTEMNVRFKGMQNEMEGILANEAKKRQSEHEKLRGEIHQLRDELSKLNSAIRAEVKEAQDLTQRGVDRSLSAVKLSLTESQGRISDLNASIVNLQEELKKLRGEKDGVSAAGDKLKGELQSQLTTVFAFLGTSWSQAQSAVSNGTEREAFLKTPALASITQRLRLAEEKGEQAKNEAAKANAGVLSVDTSVKKLVEDLSSLRDSITTVDKQIRDLVGDEDKKLSRRIDDLEGKVLSVKSSTPTAIVDTTPAVNAMRAEIDQLAKALKQVRESLLQKADSAFLQSKCEQSLLEAVSAKTDLNVEELRRDITELKKHIGTLMTASGQRPDIISSPSSDEDFAEIRNELLQLRSLCEKLDQNKADKSELVAGLADLAKKTEKALSDFFNMQQTHATRHPSPTTAQDSTAGRFRCISCNRDAGPLQEQVNERITKSQFPPSTMLVHGQQQQTQPRNIVNSRQAVPGLREYGGTMTTSRKKLMNYYVWLQDKNDHPNPTKPRPTSATSRKESPRSNSPSHPWAGAQSGQGVAGERQCGDHGTPEPEAIGLDGKYYVGVISTGTVASSRPRSAPHHGRRNLDSTVAGSSTAE